MDEVMVTVLCTVYNHEKYLRKCLDGFVMQKTDFKFEVIVHDDASTDHSADIIREYTEKYPLIFFPIYQSENQYSKGVFIARDFLLPEIKGKYVARCEGDDYWCNENKLQLQYEAMEKHPECHICLHKVQGIYENGKEKAIWYPARLLKTGVLERDVFMDIITDNIFFHISSSFIRTCEYKDYLLDDLDFVRISRLSGVGDIPMMLYFGTLGSVYYIDEAMSHYRMLSVGSWTSKMKEKKVSDQLKHADRMINMYESFNEYSNKRFFLYVERAKEHWLFIRKLLLLNDKEKLKLYFEKNNRWRFKQLNKKEKLALILRAYTPRLWTIYLKTKKNT